MFERLISFLKQLPGASGGPERPKEEDPRLAAAALLFYVIDADGVRLDVERQALRDAWTRAHGLSGRELDVFLEEAEAMQRRSVDLYAFTSVLKRHLDETARIEFIGLMWEIVFADGEMSELEDNIVWRVAELIGVERRDRIAMRQRVDPSREDGNDPLS